MQYQEILKDVNATDAFGKRFAQVLQQHLLNSNMQACLIFLDGNLGAGKTSLVRACLRGLGVVGAIKSPTYTLLEPYDVNFSVKEFKGGIPQGLKIAHLDLYRLQEPEELDYIGGRDLKQNYQLIFVEWPQKGHGCIPKSDINIQLNHRDSGREILFDTTDKEIIKLLKS